MATPHIYAKCGKSALNIRWKSGAKCCHVPWRVENNGGERDRRVPHARLSGKDDGPTQLSGHNLRRCHNSATTCLGTTNNKQKNLTTWCSRSTIWLQSEPPPQTDSIWQSAIMSDAVRLGRSALLQAIERALDGINEKVTAGELGEHIGL